MESRRFSEILTAAISGEHDAIETILSRYMPLINSQSVVDGELDEDLRQYILMRAIMLLPKYNSHLMR